MLSSPSIPASGRLAALFRVPIDYVLEVRERGIVAAAVSIPNYPSAITIEIPHASVVRHTLGPEPVRELTDNRTALITIRGNSGLRARAGYNRLGQVVFRPGVELTREFQGLLDLYQRKAAADTNRVDLVFRAFEEGWHYRCEIEVNSLDRDAGRSPHTWDWQVRLRGYQISASQVPPNLLSPVSDAFALAASYVQAANDYLALAGNGLANVRGDLETLRAPLTALQQTGSALGQVVEGAREIARFPATLVADFANAAVLFNAAWEGVVGNRFEDPLGINGWSALRGEWALMQTRLGYAAEDAPRDAMTILGLSGGGSRDVEDATTRTQTAGLLAGHRAQGEARGIRRGVQQETVVQLREGESLTGIAERVYGDPSLWIVIAEYNGWQNAHRLGSGRPARPGDTVRVPLAAVATDLQPAARDPFLRDLYLDDDGDLVFTASFTGAGDLRVVTGAENLRQALAGRLRTVAGESAGFPRYGLPLVVGSGSSSGLRAYAAAHISDQLLRDPRVAGIGALVVEDEGDALVAEVEVIVGGGAGEVLTVLAPLPSRV